MTTVDSSIEVSSRRKSPRLTARQNAQLRENYERALKDASITEADLARRTGVARHTLTDIGKSEGGPKLATLLAIADELGLYSVEELLGLSGTKHINELTDEVD